MMHKFPDLKFHLGHNVNSMQVSKELLYDDDNYDVVTKTV